MITIEEIIGDAARAVHTNFRVRNQRAFSEKPRQDRLVAERKRQIREWIAVLRILQDPLNHSHVLARVTDRGEFSGRHLMGHSLRYQVITAGAEAIAERALDQQQQAMEQASA